MVLISSSSSSFSSPCCISCSYTSPYLVCSHVSVSFCPRCNEPFTSH